MYVFIRVVQNKKQTSDTAGPRLIFFIRQKNKLPKTWSQKNEFGDDYMTFHGCMCCVTHLCYWKEEGVNLVRPQHS